MNDILEVWKFVNYISPTLPNMRVDDYQLSQSIQELQREVNELRRVVTSEGNTYSPKN
jgi:hypothetical protein